MTTWKPVALSALHRKHAALGAVMVDRDGWQVPARYAPPQDEVARLSGSVGLADFSPAAKLNVQGDGVDSLLAEGFEAKERLEVGRMSLVRLAGLGPGQTFTTARLAHDELLVLGPPGSAPAILEHMTDRPDGCVHFVDVTSGFASVAITGPRARRLLARATELDLRESRFPDMSCAQGKVVEIECVVLRHDVGDLLGFELHFSRDYAEYVWDSLFEAGHDLDLVPYGVEARALLTRS